MKTRPFILIASVSAVLVGCSKNDESENETTSCHEPPHTCNPCVSSAAQASQHPAQSVANDPSPNVLSTNEGTVTDASAATNSGVSAFTRGDKAASESDVGIIQRIRKSLLTDESVAAVANNISIISSNGNVVLHGTVPSEIVKMSVGDRAKAVRRRQRGQ